MAFFNKLKDRLFKSSSKLEEGLDAIVAEGGEAEPASPGDDRPAAEASQGAPRTPAEETSVPQEQPRADPEETNEEDRPEFDPADPSAPAIPGRPSHIPGMAPAPVPTPPVGSEPPRKAGGLFGRLLGRDAATESDARPAPAAAPRAPVVRRVMDDAMLEQLEELLIAADMGVDTALRVTGNMAESHFGRRLSSEEIRAVLAREIARVMEPVAVPMPLYPQRPQVVLVVGVNGSGKTTTIGKLASQFRAAGKSVIIAAGDTFRAAAVEQLQVWGERAGVPVLTAPEGSDPASLAYDALARAQEEGADLLLIDTAGRLQNRADLMEELAKIVRVIRKRDAGAPHNTLLVLDATTGQNAINQVETFRKIADVTGLVMTKLDGTAKGGILVALADRFGLPIHAIGVGEQIDDLSPFDPEDFAAALTGLEQR